MTGIPPIQMQNWRKMGAIKDEEDIIWEHFIPGKYIRRVNKNENII